MRTILHSQHSLFFMGALACLTTPSFVQAQPRALVVRSAPFKILDGQPTRLFFTGNPHHPTFGKEKLTQLLDRHFNGKSPVRVDGLADARKDPFTQKPIPQAKIPDLHRFLEPEWKADRPKGERLVVLTYVIVEEPRTKKSPEWVKDAADGLEKYAKDALARGARGMFFAEMVQPDHIMAGKAGNKFRRAGLQVFDALASRKIPGVERGPLLQEKLEKHKHLFRDDRHFSDAGKSYIGCLWFETLLRHDGLQVTDWLHHEMDALVRGQEPARVETWFDPSFETLPIGTLTTSGKTKGWEVQRTGRDGILNRLDAACVEDKAKAKSGQHLVRLSIPKDTVGFEFVTIGQRLRLEPGHTYEASVWVRWPDGPDQAPAKASQVSGHPSAIVSFWARHRDGEGSFAGRDEWLFDNQWRKLSFRFRAIDPDLPTLIYVSLLPNQKPRDTTILLDDFTLTKVAEPAAKDARGNLVKDAEFAQQKPGDAIVPPWYFANLGGKGIPYKVVALDKKKFITLTMDKGTSNFESAHLWQHFQLTKAARYEMTCTLRWDNFAPKAPAPIVNFGIYHEDSRTWHGPIDQVLDKTGDWRTYRFIHDAPDAGAWKIYIQLNGWGNFGNGVTISVSEITCTPAREKP